MELETKTIENVVLCTLNGSIDGKTAPEAQAKISEKITEECRLVLDLSGVNYMSSAGLRTLLFIHRQVTSSKGKLALVGLTEEVAEVMKMTGFLKHFTVADKLEDLGL